MRRIIPTEGSIILTYGAETIKDDHGLTLPAGVSNAQSHILGIVQCMGSEKPYVVKSAFGNDIELKDGDKVMFDRSKTTEIELDGHKYLIINLRYIIGKLDD